MMKLRNRIGKMLTAALTLSVSVLFLNFLPARPAVVYEFKAPVALANTSLSVAGASDALADASDALAGASAADATKATANETILSSALATFTSFDIRSLYTTPDNDGAFALSDSSRLRGLYDSLHLDSLGLSMQAWGKAISGFLNMMTMGTIRNTGVLSIIDFSQPSSQKRLFILDTYNGKLLFNTLVAHGRNSGTLLATRFSNRRNSFMSSLGFYVTGEPFIGQHGYSLRLEGVEKGWNDNVFNRAIIMHPADYVSQQHIQQWGYLGRSEGCPAIPEEFDRPIIESIRGGSCLFVYGENAKYAQRSHIVGEEGSEAATEAGSDDFDDAAPTTPSKHRRHKASSRRARHKKTYAA